MDTAQQVNQFHCFKNAVCSPLLNWQGLQYGERAFSPSIGFQCHATIMTEHQLFYLCHIQKWTAQPGA